MKTQNQSNQTNVTHEFIRPRGGKLRLAAGLLAATAATGALLAGQAPLTRPGSQPVGAIFVIAMENHNFTQPTNQTSPPQIFGNPAAPFINSLITPGNPNAAQVSYATAYYNAGFHVHPSEPSYVWAEAGTDFGFHSDADPKPANGNVYDVLHLTAQLNAAGIPWKNYQEDVELSTGPTNSASGTNGPVNPYYGTTQYNYAVKHNPMAFFSDTQLQNVFPLAQLFGDLARNAVGQ
ncbi:MAG TPA: alkaline phosphatase family protein, partial [Candidatus Binatia bacterium]|nr:alkaline phosphatase family protein [Candidatus Binatia bacterium]